MPSRRDILLMTPIYWALFGRPSETFAQGAVIENFDILGLAHAAALTKLGPAALGGTLLSLLEAQTGKVENAAKAKDWTVEDVKVAGKQLAQVTASVNNEVVEAFRKASGVSDLGIISTQSARSIIDASVLLNTETLKVSILGSPIARLTPAIEAAVVAPTIRTSLTVLAKSPRVLAETVKSFAGPSSPIALRTNALDAIDYLPGNAREILADALNAKKDTVDQLVASMTKQLKVTGVSLASDLKELRSVAGNVTDLAATLREKNGDLQAYSASLNIAAGIVDSLGAKQIAKDMKNAAALMQQSYTVYQLFAAGTMGPIGAMALLSSGPSLLGGGAENESTSIQTMMLGMILDELREMRKEIRQRLIAIDAKLDAILDRIERTYSEIVKGNKTALLNFAEIRKDIQGVLSAVEGVAREKDLNDFADTKGRLITALQTGDVGGFAANLSSIHSYAHVQSKSSYFVGRPFQDESLRTKVARYRSTEMLIGSVNHALAILKEPLAISEVANPIEWARGALVYVEALQAMPAFSIPKIAADLQSLWEDGKSIRKAIDGISSSSALKSALSGYAVCIAEPERWQGVLPELAGNAAKIERPLRLEVRDALIEFCAGCYQQPLKRAVPTRMASGFIGGPRPVHDLFNSGRFYYDGLKYPPVDTAFKFDRDDQDPLLVAQARGIVEISQIASYTSPFLILDAPNLVYSLYTVTIKKGSDSGRVFGSAPGNATAPHTWIGLIKVMDKEPNLNGSGNWWHWPTAGANDRFSDHSGLLNYCADLIVREEAAAAKQNAVAWLRDTKFKIEALSQDSVLLKLYEFASALRLCVCFSQWRLRSMEIEDSQFTLPGEAWTSNALENVDLPTSTSEMWSIYQKSLDEVLTNALPAISLQSSPNPDGQLSHWAIASTAVANSFSDRLVNARLLRFYSMSSQFSQDRSVPIVDVTMRQLAVVSALRSIPLQ